MQFWIWMQVIGFFVGMLAYGMLGFTGLFTIAFGISDDVMERLTPYALRGMAIGALIWIVGIGGCLASA